MHLTAEDLQVAKNQLDQSHKFQSTQWALEKTDAKNHVSLWVKIISHTLEIKTKFHNLYTIGHLSNKFDLNIGHEFLISEPRIFSNHDFDIQFISKTLQNSPSQQSYFLYEMDYESLARFYKKNLDPLVI